MSITSNLLTAYKRSAWPITSEENPKQCCDVTDYYPLMIFRSMCSCWKDGKISAPPFDAALFSTDGDIPHLTVPVEGNEELYYRFHEWMRSCCAHPFMKAKAFTFGMFACDEAPIQFELMRNVVEQLGADSLPQLVYLTDAMNQGTSGCISVEEAGAILAEIEYLRQQHVRLPFLVDSTTGEVLRDDLIASAERVPALTPSTWEAETFVLGHIDLSGLHLFECYHSGRENWKEIFHTQRFKQHILAPDFCGKGQHLDVVITDLETGSICVCDSWISGSDATPVRSMHVEYRTPHVPFEFVDLIEDVCKAVVETNQPAHYCGQDSILIEWVPALTEGPDPFADGYDAVYAVSDRDDSLSDDDFPEL